MSPKGIALGLILVLVFMQWGGAVAQSGCTNALTGLTPCLNFVTGNSSAPSSSCCSKLSSVVQSQPQCICSAINGGAAALGITINQSLALTLPGACNVQIPPLNNCNAVANGPTTSAISPVNPPTSSPSDSSDDNPETPTTPSVPSIPSGSASKTVPTTGSTYDGSIVKTSIQLTISVLLIATCGSNVFRF